LIFQLYFILPCGKYEYNRSKVSYYTHGGCQCRRAHTRINRVVGMTDEMLINQDINVFISRYRRCWWAFPWGGQFRMVIDSKRQKDFGKGKCSVGD
jgi:phenylacetate-coenzyme A ligase PaaK-like adenylate-forming protein